jgi:hypothetical protein
MQQLTTVQREKARPSRFSFSVLMTWKLWLGVALIAVIAVAAFNWGWLVAAGVAPILLAVLPCLAMCALGLCMGRGGKESTLGH